MQQRKIPALAALLNFFVPGAGYIYNGRRVRFGILLVTATALTLLSPTDEEGGGTEVGLTDVQALIEQPGFIALSAAALLIAAAFAYDAWSDANAVNEEKALDAPEEE